jgi:hypothetical protein
VDRHGGSPRRFLSECERRVREARESGASFLDVKRVMMSGGWFPTEDPLGELARRIPSEVPL